MDDANRRGVCPNCGKNIKPGHGVGSGSMSQGYFCSLECAAAFHEEYYQQRADDGIPRPNGG
jgi:hypothetical protein